MAAHDGMRLHALAASLLIAAAGTSIAGCGAIPHTVTLASGSHVKVLEEVSDTYKDRHGARKGQFMVEYMTAQNFEDPEALRNEMYDVFDFYRARIEQGGFTRLDLTPMKGDTGGGLEGRPFYLERRPSGRWIVW